MSLEDRIRAHYREQQLSHAEVNAILGHGESRRGRRVGRHLAAAAIILIAAGGIWTHLSLSPDAAPPANIAAATEGARGSTGPEPGLRGKPSPDAAPPVSPKRRVAAAPETPSQFSRGNGILVINSIPPGATVYMSSQPQGLTPLTLRGLPVGHTLDIRLSRSGYQTKSHRVVLSQGSPTNLSLRLEPRELAVASRSEARRRCEGNAAKLSVMTIGARRCQVTVGPFKMGEAPFFKKSCPTGRCLLKVLCEDGKRYSKYLRLHPGQTDKVVIHGEMWR